MRKTFCQLLTLLVLALVVSCSRGDLKKGQEAYKAGNFKRARAEWQLLANRGDPEAQFRLGRLYDRGEGVEQDKAKAVLWYKKAAAAGVTSAQYNLALAYYLGEGGPPDKTLAATWFRRAAEKGDGDARYALGNMYLNGEGVNQDTAKGMILLRQGADAGDAAAQCILGTVFLDGLLVPKDLAQGIKLIQTSADQDCGAAQSVLGQCYYHGTGVKEDKVLAAKWLRRAAEKGIPLAERWMGLLCSEGDGVPKDDAEATNWFRRAAQHGEVESQAMLGNRYYDGAGVPRDYEEAYFWYNIAAAAGSKPAATLRDAVGKLFLTQEQVTRAQKRASAWHPNEAATSPSTSVSTVTADATGTGFVVSMAGHVLTAAHCVDGFSRIRLRLDSGVTEDAQVVAKDIANDLALIKVAPTRGTVASFRDGRGPRLGDLVTAVGFPLHGFLASGIQVAAGNVSALGGPGDDTRLLQITAPIQQGNSGGALFDASGNVVGVVVSKLNALKIAAATGDIPENVGFAISLAVVRAFLDSKGVDYETSSSSRDLTTADIAERGRKCSVLIECWR